MLRIPSAFYAFLIVSMGHVSVAHAKNQKLAQAGFEFLSVVSDARAVGLAEAMTSLELGSSALFFNPAGMADMRQVIDLSISHNRWIAEIQHNTFSLSFSPAKGRYGVLGVSFQNVNYGDFYGTKVNLGTDAGYDDTGIFTLSAHAFGVGYAKRLTDRFSVGGQIRLVTQNLGKSTIPQISATLDTTAKEVRNVQSPLAFDFGTQFKTGFKSLVFGMSIRNFSREIQYAEEAFQLPLVFNLGVSLNLLDWYPRLSTQHALYLSCEASHYRSRAEQFKVGLEWRLWRLLTLRGGYLANSDESGLTFGLGVSRMGFTFDYAFTPYGVFGNVQRMSFRFSL